jgi:hypothetical protein
MVDLAGKMSPEKSYSDVALKIVRFVALNVGTLTLGVGLCHLLQLPARMGWDHWSDRRCREGFTACSAQWAP